MPTKSLSARGSSLRVLPHKLGWQSKSCASMGLFPIGQWFGASLERQFDKERSNAATIDGAIALMRDPAPKREKPCKRKPAGLLGQADHFIKPAFAGFFAPSVLTKAVRHNSRRAGFH